MALRINGQNVKIIANTDSSIILSNGKISFTFHKYKAELSGIRYLSHDNLLGKKGSAYLNGPGFSMNPSTFRIVKQDSGEIEIAFYHKASNHFNYDLHYIVRKNTGGIYCFLVESHLASDPAGDLGQTRWGLRADESLFDYHLVRDTIQGSMPAMKDLEDGKKLQDWTYQMADGQIYTKYNYADYIEGRYVHGMAGTSSGLGIFVIQPSHEYLNGGPTKQYQNVHSTPFLICMFNCGHFLSDIRKGDNIIAGNWTKFYGPFLLYVNHGSSVAGIWKDAKRQAVMERDQWPYKWVQSDNYPLKREEVEGTLVDQDGKAVANAAIVLADSAHDWQAQSEGYIFSERTDGRGNFTLRNVRSGTYTLYAFGGNNMKELRRDGIKIEKNKTLDLRTIKWASENASGKTIWQIGTADRKTTGFKYSRHKRVYGLFDSVTANLDFTIGRSKENTDWYYAQTKPGLWNVHFNLKKKLSDTLVLSIAIAGAAKAPVLDILVNGVKTGVLNHLGNDAGIYRSAVAGGYYQLKQISFPAALLHDGANTIGLQLADCKRGGGIMYDAVRLQWKQAME